MDVNIVEEVWKVIPSFPDYGASTLGKVRNRITLKSITFHENFGYMTVVKIT